MNRRRFETALSCTAMAIATALFLSSCGGGGGTTVAGGITGTGIEGTGTAGPLNTATVTAYALVNGAAGAQLAATTTDAQGHFSLSLGSYAGSVLLQMSGGSYVDEATGTAVNMTRPDLLTAVVPGLAAGGVASGIQVTPLTTIAQAAAQHMAGGMDDANIALANSAVGAYFMVGDILRDAPINPLLAGSANGASQDAANYGMVLAAMSQYAHDHPPGTSPAIITALARDASDGVMDGKMGNAQVPFGGNPMAANAGTVGLATALQAFAASGQNASGANVQSLQTHLSNSTGRIY
jgi:hypothetical protein